MPSFTTNTLQGPLAFNGVNELDYDMSRADLMTPFSLSLAAERAIENAKRQLDAMDERLSKAKASMDRAQQINQRSVSLHENPRQRMDLSPQRSASFDLDRAEILETKVTEMARLRNDLQDLRTKMTRTRSLAGTLNLTPPRPPRPRPADIPDLQSLALQYPNEMTLDSPAPFIASLVDHPFSPRPESSLSMTTWPRSRPLYVTMPSEISCNSFVTATESPSTPELHRLSGSIDPYSSPDSSAGALTPKKHSPSSIPRRPGSSVSDAYFCETDESALQNRLELLMNRINLASQESLNSRKRKKLLAALAILEASDEE